MDRIEVSPQGQRVLRIAIAWSLAFLIGNGIVLATIQIPSLGLGWSFVGAIVGGAIAGLMGSRMTIQQVS